MAFFNNFKTSTYKVFLAFLAINFISWFSIFLYGLFYYLYIPPVDHVRPVYFQFDSVCKNYSGCHFPTADVVLSKRGQNQILCRGQKYMVLLELDMPESEANQNIGMFMIKANMTGRMGEVLKSASRPAIMHYKSRLYQMLQAIFFSPFLFSGSYEEKQIVTVVLFEAYEESPVNATTNILIQIQNPMIEVYSSSLKIHATFTGLRYFMFYWPLMTGFLGVTTIFFFLSLIVLFAWYHFSNGTTGSLPDSTVSPYETSPKSDDFDDNPGDVYEESMAESMLQQPGPEMPRTLEIRRRVRHLLQSQNPQDDGGTFRDISNTCKVTNSTSHTDTPKGLPNELKKEDILTIPQDNIEPMLTSDIAKKSQNLFTFKAANNMLNVNSYIDKSKWMESLSSRFWQAKAEPPESDTSSQAPKLKEETSLPKMGFTSIVSALLVEYVALIYEAFSGIIQVLVSTKT